MGSDFRKCFLAFQNDSYGAVVANQIAERQQIGTFGVVDFPDYLADVVFFDRVLAQAHRLAGVDFVHVTLEHVAYDAVHQLPLEFAVDVYGAYFVGEKLALKQRLAYFRSAIDVVNLVGQLCLVQFELIRTLDGHQCFS